MQAFANAVDFKILEVCLDLQSVWPARRNRWWCLMVPSAFNFPLDNAPAWPDNGPWKKVRDVLPQPMVSAAEYDALVLSDYELEQFQRRRPLHKFLLDLDQLLPTALHSWGCQVLVCPCGCRGAFSEQRLNRGICAVLVKGTPCASGAPNFRHLSATEVALLSELNPNHCLGANHRLSLARPVGCSFAIGMDQLPCG